MEFKAQKLIDLRWDKRMKQVELARLLGVKPPVVNSWEKGRHAPSGALLLRLAETLCVEPSFFYQ
jgi:DNA-binding transcriptional regulator YiaG